MIFHVTLEQTEGVDLYTGRGRKADGKMVRKVIWSYEATSDLEARFEEVRRHRSRIVTQLKKERQGNGCLS